MKRGLSKLQKDFKEILNNNGVKSTKQRNQILNILEENNAPVTADEIFIKLQNDNCGISLSTIYRTLDTLISKNLVLKSSMFNDDKAVFEINRMQHKHYLICIKCSKIVPIDECPVEALSKDVASKTGFNIIGHKLELYGYCPDCIKKIKKHN